MNAIALCAEQTLRHHPNPALRLRELLALISDRVDRGLDAPRLTAILREYPERFRVLVPCTGEERARGHAHTGASGDAWVVAIDPPRNPPDPGGSGDKLRESVRWLSRSIDPRSRLEVSRWHTIALSERALRHVVVRKAA